MKDFVVAVFLQFGHKDGPSPETPQQAGTAKYPEETISLHLKHWKNRLLSAGEGEGGVPFSCLLFV